MKELPSKTEMAKNLATTLKDTYIGFIRTGEILSDNDLAHQRRKICLTSGPKNKECPELREDMRCTKCGCDVIVKSKIRFATCPLRKWP